MSYSKFNDCLTACTAHAESTRAYAGLWELSRAVAELTVPPSITAWQHRASHHPMFVCQAHHDPGSLLPCYFSLFVLGPHNVWFEYGWRRWLLVKLLGSVISFQRPRQHRIQTGASSQAVKIYTGAVFIISLRQP
ncbi:hypothetical protein VTI28DRAFT_8337 [Corynascus sepedonium]